MTFLIDHHRHSLCLGADTRWPARGGWGPRRCEKVRTREGALGELRSPPIRFAHCTHFNAWLNAVVPESAHHFFIRARCARDIVFSQAIGHQWVGVEEGQSR